MSDVEPGGTVPEQEQRVAVVTGAGRGIGAAIAERLGADGLVVACLDIDEAAAQQTATLLEGQGVTAASFAADVSDEDAVEQVVAAIADRLGPPTVLVNNAGVLRDNLLFKMTAQEWDTVMQVHLRGTFLMTRAVQKHMTAASYGRIVNLSSTSALGNRGQANYSAAKAGLQGFTKTVAHELGRFGVTCNAVAPGFIVTEMTRTTAERVGQSFEEFSAARVANIPVARPGQPEDVADAVSFFCSPRAGFVSGQVLYVAGGPRT
jgi:3-oxoacyl-[acyl-carrier protein] reductase